MKSETQVHYTSLPHQAIAREVVGDRAEFAQAMGYQMQLLGKGSIRVPVHPASQESLPHLLRLASMAPSSKWCFPPSAALSQERRTVHRCGEDSEHKRIEPA